MDQFGIGTAVRAAAEIYFRSSRHTGRTTTLVESVKDGDRIIFHESCEADRVRRLCLDRGVTVECLVIDPENPERVFNRGTPNGRTIFDHGWLEKRYLLAINSVMRDIDHLERQASGYGAAHRETKRRYQRMSNVDISP